VGFRRHLNAIRQLTNKWPKAGIKLVEDRANGPALISTLRREVSGLIAVEPDGSKEARCFAVSPEIESGNVFLPHPSLSPWVGDLIEEASLFPNSRYKDQVDAMTQGLMRLQQTMLADIPSPVSLTRVSPWRNI
jgi:predicted phage terminase large subunit-like protein